MPVHLDSPYPQATGAFRWLRGNLHTHSTRSDGQIPQQEVVRRYAAMGYDFLALSDHDVVSDYTGIDPCGMVLLAANEVSGGSPHVLDIGADGGFSILCHPSWEADFNHYPYEMLATLRGYTGIEIYNGGGYESEGSHLATDKWDRLLASGRKVWGYANDDSHRLPHIGRGWNVVAAAERSDAAILAALRNGSFYASSGVVIERLECDGPRVHVVAPNAQQIDIVGKSGRRIAVMKEPTLSFDFSEIPDPHFRIECSGKPGEQAWSQPIYIRDGVYEQGQSHLARLDALKKSTLHAFRSSVAPQMTGTLADPMWQKAEVFSTFRNLRDASPAPVKTRVQAIFAGDCLYFAFRCEEPELEKIDAGRDKALWQTDSVEVFLDPEGRGASCWHVGINAGGHLSSATRGASLGEAPQVSGKAGRYVVDSERGWSAELAIQLRGTPAMRDSRWGLHICRNRRPVQGHFVWSWVGKSNHNREQYGSLIL